MATLRLAIDARQAVVGAREFDRAVDGSVSKSKQFDNQIRQTEGRLTKLRGAAGTAGKALLGIFAGLTVATGVRAGLEAIGSYEQALVTLEGVSRSTTRQLQAQEAISRELGASTAFSATEAAEGLLFLARAGFDVEAQIDALPATLDLAQVGLLGLGEAADIASNVVKQFGLDAAQTRDVVDTLVIVSNRANTDVRQLSEALKFAGPVANALGEDVASTSAALGALGDAGIQASMAGTNLRGILLGLTDDSPKLNRALRGLGLEMADIDPRTRSLVEIFEAFGDAQLDAAGASQIFGRRNAAAALILADSTEQMKALEQATEDYGGEASRIARLQEQTLIGQFKALKSALEEAALSTGDAGLAGAAKTAVSTLTELVRFSSDAEASISDLSDTAQTGGVALITAFSPAPATIKLAAAALFLFRDNLVDVNGETVTVGQTTSAVFTAISDNSELMRLRVQKVFVVLANIGKTAFLTFRDAALDTLDAVSIRALQVQRLLPDLGGNITNSEVDDQIFNIRRGQRLREQDYEASIEALATEIQNIDSQILALENKTGGVIDSFFSEIAQTGEQNAQAAEAARIALEAGQTAIVGFFAGAGSSAASQGPIATEKIEEIHAAVAALDDEVSQDNGTSGVQRFFEGIVLAAETSAEALDRLQLEERMRRANELGDGFSRALAGPLFDLLTARSSFDEFFESLLRNLTDTAIQLLVIKPLIESISGSADSNGGGSGLSGFFNTVLSAASSSQATANALGNVFSGGRISAFANGGIVNGPTLFPMADGRSGLMGEAGPEAIMPLKRGQDGRLGVEASGNQSITLNINGVTDANSFQASERQIISRLKALVRN